MWTFRERQPPIKSTQLAENNGERCQVVGHTTSSRFCASSCTTQLPESSQWTPASSQCYRRRWSRWRDPNTESETQARTAPESWAKSLTRRIKCQTNSVFSPQRNPRNDSTGNPNPPFGCWEKMEEMKEITIWNLNLGQNNCSTWLSYISQKNEKKWNCNFFDVSLQPNRK